MGNGPYVLMDAPTPPPLVVPPLLFPLVELMPRIAITPFGARIPLVIET
jgi:hypothetical protein